MLTPAHPTEFNEAAVAVTRKCKARVTITWTDAYLDPSIFASAPLQENRISYPKQTADMIEVVPHKWFHADPVWSHPNSVLPLAFNQWSRGNGPAEKYSGNMPVNNSDYTAVITNCTSGQGFQNNSGDGYFESDGDDTCVNLGDVTELNSTQKFILEFWFSQDVMDQTDFLFVKRISDTSEIRILTFTDGNMYLRVCNGSQTYGYFDYSTKITAGQIYHMLMVYDGTQGTANDRIKLYINDELITLSYSGTLPTSTANLSGNDAYLGYTSGSIDGKIYWFNIYNNSTAAVIATIVGKHYSYGRDMNLKAYNKGDLMHIGAGTAELSNNLYPAPAPESYAIDFQMGWWGKDHCDGNGDFDDPQILTIQFSSRPVVTLRVVGDSAWGEYPVDFNIKVMDGSASTLYSEVVTSNAAVTWSQDISSLDINDAEYIELTVLKWSHPFRVVKIAEAYTSIVTVYDGDEIMKMSINEEMEIKDGTLPIGNISCNELDLSLNNVDDKFFPSNTDALLYTQVKKNRRIVAELGFTLASGEIEYIPMGTYWSGDWKVDENGTVASTSGRDRLELLRKSTFYPSELYQDYNLKQLAEVILTDALSIMPDLEYNIDSDLENYIIPYSLGYYPVCHVPPYGCKV